MRCVKLTDGEASAPVHFESHTRRYLDVYSYSRNLGVYASQTEMTILSFSRLIVKFYIIWENMLKFFKNVNFSQRVWRKITFLLPSLEIVPKIVHGHCILHPIKTKTKTYLRLSSSLVHSPFVVSYAWRALTYYQFGNYPFKNSATRKFRAI